MMYENLIFFVLSVSNFSECLLVLELELSEQEPGGCFGRHIIFTSHQE